MGGSKLNRLLALKWVLCLALLSELAVTPHLWTTDRPFPTIPVIASLPDLPQPICILLTALLVLSLLLVGLLPKPKALLFAPPLLGAILVLFDIDRLQPWLYQYLLMFLALGFADWDDPTSKRSTSAFSACGFIVSAIYFWSGSHKLNGIFATETFPFLLQPMGELVTHALKSFWFIAPVFEMATGILLLVPRTRILGVVGAVLMHAFLLAMLGPLGLDYNSSIWPWNLCSMGLVLILFFRREENLLVSASYLPVGGLILVLWGLLPALNYVQRWDGFLSGSYYSGKLPDAWIYFNQEGYDRLPNAFKTKALTLDPAGPYRLDVTQWTADQLNIPPYAEPGTYIGLARKLIEAGVPEGDMRLLVRDFPSLTDKKRDYSPRTIR